MFLLAVVVALVAGASAAVDPMLYVRPSISTGGFGFGVGGNPVGPQVPFGALRLSPDGAYDDNAWLSFQHLGGYSWNDTHIRAFSHTHMVGSGVTDYGNIGVMATRAIDKARLTNHGYNSRFSHADETMEAGYYAVGLQTPNVHAELTACGTHAGAHRYTFANVPAGGNGSFILVDMAHSLAPGAVRAANVTVSLDAVSGNTIVSGWALHSGSLTGRNGRGIDIYFVARLNTTATAFGVWDGSGEPQWGRGTLNGTSAGAFLEIAEIDATVEMTVAISFVSMAQARRNLNVQAGNRSFDTCRADTQAEWRSKLNLVQVESGAQDDMIMFYTALYHTMLPPTTWTEADNVYMGMDNKAHVAPSNVTRFTDLSIWDIHRSQIPLLTLLLPRVAENIANSLVGMYQEGGDIPRWPIANVYSGCMIGTHGNIIISELVSKGLTGFDIPTAYEAMRLQATDPSRPKIGRAGLTDYIQLGYVPVEDSSESASLTLAYSYDDWALSNVAAHLGHTADQALFLNRSQSYRNIFHTPSLYMCPRLRNGTFQCQKDPAWQGWVVSEAIGFTEGNSEEWRWFVPHDLEGLVDLFGGPEIYAQHLARFFDLTNRDNNTDLPNPYYWAGNEPGILEPFQFNVAGRADLTQKYSRAVMRQSYNSQPHGVPGNDDYGTLSAWFVFASLGFYPLAGTDRYLLGSPTFETASVNINNGTLRVVAHDVSSTNIYVQKVALNGAAINMTTAEVTHAALLPPAGGTVTLEFWMGITPVQAK